MKNITTVILAAGKSTRFVSNKSKYISGQVIRVDGGQFTTPI